MEDNYFQSFKELCEHRKIICQITESKYLEMRLEYLNKLNWWRETQKCVDWLYDNGLSVISRPRLRNWMTRSIKWAKEREQKQQTKFADKQGGYIEKAKPYKREPLWVPPV